MSNPIFHLGEVAKASRYASDARVRERHCEIRTVMKPVGGENRYGIQADNGAYTVVLESTLQKVFERSDWGMLRGIWQPKREAR